MNCQAGIVISGESALPSSQVPGQMGLDGCLGTPAPSAASSGWQNYTVSFLTQILLFPSVGVRWYERSQSFVWKVGPKLASHLVEEMISQKLAG